VAGLGYRPGVPEIVFRLTASGWGLLFLQSVHTRYETHPSTEPVIYSIPRAISLEVKWRPSSVEIRNEQNCVSSPPYNIMTGVGLYVYSFEQIILNESK
jgi:hypothetical protein